MEPAGFSKKWLTELEVELFSVEFSIPKFILGHEICSSYVDRAFLLATMTYSAVKSFSLSSENKWGNQLLSGLEYDSDENWLPSNENHKFKFAIQSRTSHVDEHEGCCKLNEAFSIAL